RLGTRRSRRAHALEARRRGPAGRRLEVRKKQVTERVGVGQRAPDNALERVERRDGRNGDENAYRGGDERLGDASHDRFWRERRRARGRGHLYFAQLVERSHDSDDGSKQPDERGVIAERAEEGESFLEL